MDLLAHFSAIETDSYRMNRAVSLAAAIGRTREGTETFGGFAHCANGWIAFQKDIRNEPRDWECLGLSGCP
jgi:hypothetical protein